MVSVIIPAREEPFLMLTIRDVLAKALGDVEVLVGLNGWEPDSRIADERVRYFQVPATETSQMRHIINQGADMARGDYLMKLDAHCMVGDGFDEVLTRDHEPDWVQVPRRHRLAPETWSLQWERCPIDYEYLRWEPLSQRYYFTGEKWDALTQARLEIPSDDILVMQASCWFMAREWFRTRGFMQTEGYGGWAQEGPEVAWETLQAGGKVKVNKNTWYAHFHKRGPYSKLYWVDTQEIYAGYAYSYRHWIHDNKDFFIDLIERFAPLPGWPDNWKEILWHTS